MSGKRRGRVSFADPGFSSTTSLTSLPSTEGPSPTRAPLDELAHNPHNPRDGYDDANIGELADSLAAVGQLQPAAVVSRDVFLAHYPDDADPIGSARWVVMTGNRRLTAARRAGLTDLAITVQDRLGSLEDPHLVEATLVENIHREALPPLLEARELDALVERYGTAETVAARVGKSAPWVSQRRSLLKLTAPMQDMLRAGEMTFREARKVAAAEPDKQEQVLEALRAPAVPQAERADEEPSPAPRRGRPRKQVAPPDVDAIATDLQRRLTREQLNELIELLSGEAFTR